ncbi:MAG: membrane protein insertase YidC [Lentisphaerae bacterium]|nr:membrane protein insertase YidC [Lentisphaerota bacterium]
MKKQDIVIVVLLFILMMAWPMIYTYFFPAPPAPPAATNLPTQVSGIPPVAHPPGQTPPAAAHVPVAARPEPTVELQAEPSQPLPPETLFELSNTNMSVTLSSRGGGLVTATFTRYRQKVDKDSGPIVLDFSNQAALVYGGLMLSATVDINPVPDAAEPTLRMTGQTSSGLSLTRTVVLREDYRLTITDVFTNETTNPVALAEHTVQLGPMSLFAGETADSQAYLGQDTQPSIGGEKVHYWADKLAGLFEDERKDKSLPVLPRSILKTDGIPLDWMAVKNKYFVQILTPIKTDNGGYESSGYRLNAGRALAPGEKDNPALAPKNALIEKVSGALMFPEKAVEPGGAATHEFNYYIGPKKFSILKTLAMNQNEVMEFGMWSWFCAQLLWLMNAIYGVVPNYGVAIILLTFLVRIVFWPVTHKSTESMKKMQELQPLITELRAKHKDNPKKVQEETLALYKKHKVNPLSGCLPILIQIPVFYALFVVLRSAIELRFADFLWIKDLSEPERLFADVLPYPLNILPIFMAVTMALQQKLMPTTDATQQKMMLIVMPVMMLFMFYNMASGLVLYWSVSQCGMIVQQLMQKYRVAHKAKMAAAAA